MSKPNTWTAVKVQKAVEKERQRCYSLAMSELKPDFTSHNIACLRIATKIMSKEHK